MSATILLESHKIQFGHQLNNICSPCVIYIPKIVKSIYSGKHIMYCSHHKGKYIKGFVSSDSKLKYWTEIPKTIVGLKNCTSLYDHISAPDILFDQKSNKFILSFHGKLIDENEKNIFGKQGTIYAESKNGIDFTVINKTISGAYSRYIPINNNKVLRIIKKDHNNLEIDIVNYSLVQNHSNIKRKILIPNLRHFSGRILTKKLEIYYTELYDFPERIKRKVFNNYGFGPCLETIIYQMPYPKERSNLNIFGSFPGMAFKPYYGCRDPYVINIKNVDKLFFCHNGESAIASVDLNDLFFKVKKDYIFLCFLKRFIFRTYRWIYWKIIK